MPVGRQWKGKWPRRGTHPDNGRVVLEALSAVKPFAYVVKCAGGCGADMLIPLERRWHDGRVEAGDPDEKKWCLPCGSREFMGLDIGPGYGARKA